MPTQAQVIQQPENLTFVEWIKRSLAKRLNRIAAVRAYRTSKVHHALRMGQVKVHSVRPIGASTYMVQIDGEPTLPAIRAAWQPSLIKRVVAGVRGTEPIMPIRQISTFEHLLFDAQNSAQMRLMATSSLAGATASVEAGVPLDRFLIGSGDGYEIETVEAEPVNDAATYTINDAVASLLRAAGLHVASCDEVGSGGYGTRFMQVCIA